MRRTRSWVWPWLICGLVVLPAGGCAVISDVFAPGLAEQFGLDPATIKASQGVIIVSFKNATKYSATFYAFAARDASDLSAGRNFSLGVDAGQVGNEVLDCPVGIIILANIGANNSATTSSVVVAGSTGAATEIDYSGGFLRSGQVFTFGDVVEVGLYSTTTTTGASGTATETFTLSVRVIPGQ